MEISLETKNSYKEVITVLKALPNSEKAKIPNNIWHTLEVNSNSNYDFNVDIYVSINAWNLSEKAKLILSVIFRDYLTTDAQKEKIKLIELAQYRKLDKISSEKYNSDNIFKNNKIYPNIIKNEVSSNLENNKTYNIDDSMGENQLIKIDNEEKWWKKIINKILNAFRRK